MGAALGTANASKGDADQTVLTPPSVIEIIDSMWPEGITLDPCGAHGSIVRSTLAYRFDEGDNGLELP
jgi:hypothetical protein